MQNGCIEEELIALKRVIGENVRNKRVEKGYSQLKLSEEIGQKSTTIISQSELAKNKHFNIEHIYKIAKVLDVDVVEFFKQNSQENSSKKMV